MVCSHKEHLSDLLQQSLQFLIFKFQKRLKCLGSHGLSMRPVKSLKDKQEDISHFLKIASRCNERRVGKSRPRSSISFPCLVFFLSDISLWIKWNDIFSIFLFLPTTLSSMAAENWMLLAVLHQSYYLQRMQ